MKFSSFFTERSMDIHGPNKLIEQLRAARNHKEMLDVMLKNHQIATSLGEGEWGIAYYGNKRGKYVIKIGRTQLAHQQEQFFSLCMKNTEITLLPRIYDYQMKSDSSFWIVIEKLNVRDAVPVAMKFFNVRDTYELDDIFEVIAYNSTGTYADNNAIMDIIAVMSKRNARQLEMFCQALETLKADIIDIGFTNIGLRQNGELVVFDPLPG